MLTITSVSAIESNDTVLTSEDQNSIEVIPEKTNIDDNNIENIKDLQTDSKSDNEIKTLDKNMDTTQKEYSYYSYYYPTLTVGSTNHAFVDDKFSVYGRLSYENDRLSFRDINIYVDNEYYTTTKTNEWGDYSLKLSIASVGYKKITAKFSGSYIYEPAVNTTSIQINKKTTKLTLGNTYKVYVGDKVSIYGRLSSRNIGLANKIITITVDDKEYTTRTNKYGDYKLQVTPYSDGTKTVTATYDGTNIYSNSKSTSYFLSNKKVTTLTLGNTKKAYVDGKISVYGRLSARGIGLNNKTVFIYVDGDEYTATTNKYGDYKLQITPQREGYYDIHAKYKGSNIYTSDNKYSSCYVDEINQITVGSTKSVYVGDKVSVYGRLTSRGKPLAYANVYISTYNNIYTAKTNKYGDYKINVTPQTEGKHSITASYYGTYPAEASTYVNVNKKATYLTLGSSKPGKAGEQVCIYGKLTFNGKNLAYQKLTINLNGNIYTTTTTKYGNYNYNTTATKTGSNTITVTYDGTNIYKNSANTTTFQIKKNTQISIDPIGKVYEGDTFYISGRLTSNGAGLSNQKIVITYDGFTYDSYTDSYGYFGCYGSTYNGGTYTLKVTYNGNSEYKASTLSKNLKITSYYSSYARSQKPYIENPYSYGPQPICSTIYIDGDYYHRGCGGLLYENGYTESLIDSRYETVRLKCYECGHVFSDYKYDFTDYL